MKIFVCCSARNEIPKKYLDSSANLLDNIFKYDNDLIFGADDTGIMKIAYDNAKKHKRVVYGVCPKNYKDDLNRLACDCEIISDDAIKRAKDAINLSDVVLILPGGIGTYTELFIALEAKRNHEYYGSIIIYNETKFFDDLLKIINKMYKEGFILNNKEPLFYIADNIESCLKYLTNY